MALIGLLFSKVSIMLIMLAGVGIGSFACTKSIEHKGALKERAKVLEQDAKENTRIAKRLVEVQKHLNDSESKRQSELLAGAKREAALQAQLKAIPTTAEGDLCPVDCKLPPQ